MTASRRTFLSLAPALGILALPRALEAAEPASPAAPVPPALDDVWPTQPPERAREVVGVSLGNFARVKELVGPQPALAKATWDWGFGDWESALGAASHVGNREIAEFLMQNGARPTLFTAAMLGHLATVKAFVAAFPGIQRTTGPHSLTLLHHAKAGGDPAAEVAAFLESLGDADPKPVEPALDAAQVTMLTGTYVFGTGPRDRVEMKVDAKGRLGFERAGGSRRNLVHVGSFAFFPVGAPAVRIRVEVVSGKAVALTVHDPDVVLRARRS
jgi:hypothetical protein